MNLRIKIRAAILMLLLFSGLILSIFHAFPHLTDQDLTYTAYVYKDGTLIHTIPLNEIRDTRQYMVQTSEHDYNMIQVISGAICICEASCPDKICVGQGYISNSLVPITCLPNRLVIELKADNAASDIDAVTH